MGLSVGLTEGLLVSPLKEGRKVGIAVVGIAVVGIAVVGIAVVGIAVGLNVGCRTKGGRVGSTGTVVSIGALVGKKEGVAVGAEGQLPYKHACGIFDFPFSI